MRIDLGGRLLAATAPPAWYERALDSLPRIAEIFTALLGAIALAGIVRGIYRRTLGRRRDRYARLSRLGTNGNLSFFSAVLGEPPAIERTFVYVPKEYDESGELLPEAQRFNHARAYKEAVWIDRDFYVHALADEDHTVHAYSVTTRSKRFHPTFRPPGGSALPAPLLWRVFRREYRYKPNDAIKLGKTRFAALGRPGQAAAWIGAHNWHYFEPYYFGNPGLYQNFVYSINDAGIGTPPFPSDWLMGGFAWGFSNEPIDPKLALAQVATDLDEEELDDQLAGDDEEGPEDKPEWDETELEGATWEVEEFEDPPLPPSLETFRRRARINTYTVIGPDLFLDHYPLAEGQLDEYPVTFGVTSYRVRTLG